MSRLMSSRMSTETPFEMSVKASRTFKLEKYRHVHGDIQPFRWTLSATSYSVSATSSTVSPWTSLPRRLHTWRMYAAMVDATSVWTSLQTILETRAPSLRMSSLKRHQQHAHVRRDVLAHVMYATSRMTFRTSCTSSETSVLGHCFVCDG